jgi:hypothetical protein
MNKAYHDGESARKRGDKVGDNPYPEKDENHFHWMDGWVCEAISESRPIQPPNKIPNH